VTSPRTGAPRSSAPRPATAKVRARPGRWISAIVLGGAALIAFVAYRFSQRLLDNPLPAPVAALPTPVRSSAGPEVESHVFQVERAEGRVEAFREGKWFAVEPGNLLTLQDVVRTGTGHAVLRLGSSEIELRERVEIKLEYISRAGANVNLRRGRLVARVVDGRESLSVTARETKTTSNGTARFVVQADDQGRVSVAATEGAVRFAASGSEVTVGAGETSHADDGQAPAAPEKIPESVLLSVYWPSPERHKDRATVRGAVSPGTSVDVNGVRAQVSATGEFSAAVPLQEGNNKIEVRAEDLAGRTKESSGQVFRAPTSPPGIRQEGGPPWSR